MNRLLLFLLVFSPLTALTNSGGGFFSYHIHRDSHVAINGSTNINSFFCLSDSDFPRGSIVADFLPGKNVLQFSDAQLDLMVSSFDCRNRMMNKDFQHALGGESNPYIQIRLLETRLLETHGTNRHDQMMALVEIHINGVKKTTEVFIEMLQDDDFNFRVRGSKTLRMSDFNIQAPSPGFGLIRVSDVIDIQFNLIVEASVISLN